MGFTVGGLGVVAAERVLTIAVHVFRNRYLGVTVGRLLDQGDGISRDGRGGHALVQQGVDEGGVGPVFQQAPNKIGQKFLVPSHGGVGAHDDGLVRPGLLRRVVQGFAHAVQALVFDRDASVAGHAAHGGQGVGVVTGELAVDRRRGLDHGPGADEVVQIGRRLGRIDWVVGAAEHLGALDLGVPIGALDQAHHQTTARTSGQVGDPFDRLQTALLIGLNR